MKEKEIKALIEQDQALKEREERYLGRKYYHYKPKKSQEYIDTYSNGKIHTIKGPRQDLYINLFKMIVNQKIDYVLSKPISTQVDINMLPEFNFNDIFDKLSLGASLDTTSWLHFYINTQGRLDWVQVSDKEIIPLYDKYDKYIAGIIRYYYMDKSTLQAELWTIDGVKKYTFVENSQTKVEEKAHFYIDEKYQGEVVNTQPANFNMIPFVPLYNNKAHEGDIEDLYSMIDMYNSITLGFVDNIDLFQEALVKLKGFTGEKDELQDAMKQLRISKAVAVPADGDVEYLKVEIPVEARETILDLLKESIFTIGRGVIIERLGDGSGNITNVYIKSKFAGLDSKASDTIKQLTIFYYQLIQFISNYYNTSLDMYIEFNKTQLFNESELIASNVNSIPLIEAGLLSKETLMENNPWIDNVDEEKERITKENTITNE